MTKDNGYHRPIAYRHRDYRCRGTSARTCNRLLFRMRVNPELVEAVEIEIRCPKCGKMNVVGADATPVQEDNNERSNERTEQAEIENS